MNRTVTGFLFIFFLGALFVATQSFHSDGLWFPITTVKVEGKFVNVTRKDIAKVVTPYLKEGFWGISLSHISNTLRDNPWIKQARLKRVWPETILVAIKEREPLLRFGDGSVVDDHGELFSPPKGSLPANLPMIKSEAGLKKELLQEFEKISKILARAHISLTELDKNRSSMKLNTGKGMLLVTSNKSFVMELERFVDVYPTIAEEKKARMVRVDLRYRHGMAVQWK